MRIALFFGSFNPIHTGHLIIAQHIANKPEVDQVWFVVSPHNPFKNKQSLARDYDRLHLVNLAVENNPKLRSCNIEFHLPQPSYTIDTLAHLHEKYPQHTFALIMGSDNLQSFNKWKHSELILANHYIYVYRREKEPSETLYARHPKIIFCNAPLIDISATYIRQCIQEGKSVRYLVPDSVFEEMEKSRMYKN